LTELQELADKLDQVLGTQVHMAAQQTHMQSDIAEIKCEVKDVKRMVLDHDRDLAVLKDWRTQAAPHIEANRDNVVDLKMQVAKMAALGSSFGVAISIAGFIAKALGVI
jgi:chorismate mutase